MLIVREKAGTHHAPQARTAEPHPLLRYCKLCNY